MDKRLLSVEAKVKSLEDIAREQHERIFANEKNLEQLTQIVIEFKEAHKDISNTLKALEISNSRIDSYFDQFKSFMVEQQLQGKELERLKSDLAASKRWMLGIGTGLTIAITVVNLFVLK